MPGFRHQTVFGLCLALTVLAAVSVVCVALLFIDRQDIDLLQQNVTSLRQENAVLRSQLNDYRRGLVTPQEAAARSSD
jgi:Tfp pilus assembly protein PilN